MSQPAFLPKGSAHSPKGGDCKTRKSMRKFVQRRSDARQYLLDAQILLPSVGLSGDGEVG